VATSGTYTYSITAVNLILASLRLVNAYDPEFASSATSNQQSTAAEALEMMLQGWKTQGLELWERKYGVIFFQKNQATYVIGGPGPGGDHACVSTPLGANYIVTAATSGASTSATSITLDRITSSLNTVGSAATTIATGFNIGIELDTGYIQWTTVNGALTGNSVPLTAGLTSAVSAGNTVFAYQTKIHKPIQILDCFIRQIAGNDTPVNLIETPSFLTREPSKETFRLPANHSTARFAVVNQTVDSLNISNRS